MKTRRVKCKVSPATKPCCQQMECDCGDWRGYMKEEVVCNVCGTPLTFYDLQTDLGIQATPGYGSEYDGEAISLSMCCDCFDRLVRSCAISPIKNQWPEF